MHVVLIPAYEPDSRLVTLVSVLATAGPVVVVDDGSDASFAPVFEASAVAGATVVAHAFNRGKGAALRTGFALIADRWPGADVVTADADGQHTPADIARVAATLGRDGGVQPAPVVASPAAERRLASARGTTTMVLGVRAFTGRVPLRSRAGNALTRRAFRFATGRDVSDTQTGLRGFPAAMLPWLQSLPGDRFEYEFRMLLAAPSAGIETIEVPIDTVYLDGNASSHFRPLADSARIYAPLLRFTASALLAFVVDTVLLLALQAATGWLLFSVVVARVLSSAMNFAVNRGPVFRARSAVPVRTAAVRYFSLAALLLTASYGLLTALVDAGMATLPAKVVTDLTLFAVSFSVQRAVVFAPAGIRASTPTHPRE